MWKLQRFPFHEIWNIPSFVSFLAIYFEFNGIVKYHTGIYVNIYGAAESRWCEHARDNRMTYRGHELYLSSKTYLIGKEDGKQFQSKISKQTHDILSKADNFKIKVHECDFYEFATW